MEPLWTEGTPVALKNPEEALGDFYKDIQLDPKNANAINNIAEQHICNSRYAEAFKIPSKQSLEFMRTWDEIIVLYLKSISGKLLGQEDSLISTSYFGTIG